MWGHRGRRQLLTAAAKYQIVYFWKGVLCVPPMFRRPDDISRIFLKTVELQLHQWPPSTWCFSLIWSPLVKTWCFSLVLLTDLVSLVKTGASQNLVLLTDLWSPLVKTVWLSIFPLYFSLRG